MPTNLASVVEGGNPSLFLMTSDVLPCPPRKASWKRWTLALACVVAVTIIALLANAPKKAPVTVWFVRSTNEMGEKKLVFQGMNGLPRRINFCARLVTGAIDPAKALAGSLQISASTLTNAPAGTTFSFTLNAPQKVVPYYVEWWIDDVGDAAPRWYRFRMACYEFFGTHGMYDLSDLFLPTPKAHFIPSTDLKE